MNAIQTGETLPADEYEDMLAALNGMVTHWQASGIHVWSQQDATLFLQPNQIRYQIGSGSVDRCCLSNAWVQTTLNTTALTGATTAQVASITGMNLNDHIGIFLDSGSIFWTTLIAQPFGTTVTFLQPLPSQASASAYVVDYTTDLVRPLKVPSARRYIFAIPGGQPIEIPMGMLSRIDYAQIPNKTTPGVPVEVFYDPQMGYGIMNVWPAPSTGQLNAVKFTSQRPLQDYVNQRNTSDLPIEWISALRFNLAVEIATEYDCPAERFQIIKSLADEKLGMCRAWDREPESVYFGLQRFPSTRN